MDKNYFEILYSHLNFITETKKKQFSMENMKLSSIPLFSMHGGGEGKISAGGILGSLVRPWP